MTRLQLSAAASMPWCLRMPGDVKPAWLPLRSGLVLLCIGSAVRHVGPIVREALRSARWVPHGRAMAWSVR